MKDKTKKRLKILLIGILSLITLGSVIYLTNGFNIGDENKSSENTSDILDSEEISNENPSINDSTSVEEINKRVIPNEVVLDDYYTCSQGSLDNLFDGDLTTYAWLCPNVKYDVTSRYMYFNFDETLSISKIVIYSGSEESLSDTVQQGYICYTSSTGTNGTFDSFKDNTNYQLNINFGNNGPKDCTSIYFRGLQGSDSSSWILINEIEFYKN